MALATPASSPPAVLAATVTFVAIDEAIASKSVRRSKPRPNNNSSPLNQAVTGERSRYDRPAQ